MKKKKIVAILGHSTLGMRQFDQLPRRLKFLKALPLSTSRLPDFDERRFMRMKSFVPRYNYLGIEVFKEKIEKNMFVQYVQAKNDDYYGVLESDVRDIWANDLTPLLILSLEQTKAVKKHFAQEADFYLFQIMISDHDKFLSHIKNHGAHNTKGMIEINNLFETAMTAVKEISNLGSINIEYSGEETVNDVAYKIHQTYLLCT